MSLLSMLVQCKNPNEPLTPYPTAELSHHYRRRLDHLGQKHRRHLCHNIQNVATSYKV